MKIKWLPALLAVLVLSCSPSGPSPSPSSAQAASSPANAIPRTPSGKPDFNGIWQVMMNANDNLEPAAPKAAYQLVPGDFVPVPHPDIVAMGAVSAVPASFGVVEGGTIPYKAEALARREENAANWLERDPEVKCYMPGVPRATYMPHPFQIFQSESAFFIAYSLLALCAMSFWKIPVRRRWILGWANPMDIGMEILGWLKSRVLTIGHGLTGLETTTPISSK